MDSERRGGRRSRSEAVFGSEMQERLEVRRSSKEGRIEGSRRGRSGGKRAVTCGRQVEGKVGENR
jgi:hypothetical protein